MSHNVFPMPEDLKEATFKHGNGKQELELFKDEDNKVEKIIRVKRSVVKGIEKWTLLEDKNIILSFGVDDVSASQVDFLRTVEGFNFLIAQYKKTKILRDILYALENRLT